MPGKTALYVHLPFCARKCPYCEFASTEIEDPEQAAPVLEALLREARSRAALAPWRDTRFQSLFFGGGTPSLLSGEQLAALMKGLHERLPMQSGAEITIEVNPGTLTDSKVERYLEAGINRFSLGVQSLDDSVLRALGRIHSAQQARKALQRLRNAGVENLSVDLMYAVAVDGWAESWRKTVQEVIQLAPEHISAYALIVEPGTEFARRQGAGEQVRLGEEEELEQYEFLSSQLAHAGYEHYEVSNWARPEKRCRHNISYWDGSSYLALGPAGHSFDARVPRRFWNHRDTAAWLRAVNETGTGEAGSEVLTPAQRFEERLMLGLRMVAGVEEKELARQAHHDGLPWPPAALEELVKRGFLERHAGALKYTERGLLIADELETVLTREYN